MISFACTCGEKFDVPQEAAGDQFQCPACMRLVDVPQLSELEMIDGDGMFRMYDVQETPSDLAKKMAAFGGNADQRNSVDDFLASGATPPDAAPHPQLHGPRYDPETGERVMPVALKLDTALDTPHAIPMAKSVLSYSTAPLPAEEVNTPVTWWQMPMLLLTGMNLFAIAFVLLTHLLVQIVLELPAVNFFLAPFILLSIPLVVAHYCNTLEDFGANRRDRVPVLFRNGSVGDDLVKPLLNTILSALLAFGPLLLFGIFADHPLHGAQAAAAQALFCIGIFLFPAVIFTATNSGAIQNLMPLRVLSVIIVAPVRYLWAAAAFATAIVAYVIALQNFSIGTVNALQFASGAINWSHLATGTGIVFVLLTIAVYVMHLAAAWLGLIYQSHYEQFNWVLQRHEKATRTDTAAQLAELRRQGDPRVNRQKPPALSQPAVRPVQSIEP